MTESTVVWLIEPWKGVAVLLTALGRWLGLAAVAPEGRRRDKSGGISVPRMSETWLRHHEQRSMKS